MGDNQLAHKTEMKNIQSLETTRRQLRCESSKNCQKWKIMAFLKSAHQKLSGNVQSRLDFSNVENGTPYFTGVLEGMK